MRFYEKLTRLRKQKGLSQEELADVLDISRQSVYKWESGTNMPDKANLEKLTKFFNVSFNYLLDDDMDEIALTQAEAKPTVKKTKFRRVFISNHPYNQQKRVDFCNQTNLEHGYAPHQKKRIKNSAQIFNDRKAQSERILKERGYERVIQIQNNLLTYYFEDYKNRTFGFFFDGAEQFVCPFENIIDVTVKNSGNELINKGSGLLGVNVGGLILGGSGKNQEVKAPYNYYVTILYFDDEGINCEYSLMFSKFSEYLFIDNKSVNNIDIEMEVISLNLGGVTSDIANKIRGLKAQGELIKNNEIEVAELDIPAFIKRYEKDIAITQKQNQEILDYGKKLNNRKAWFIFAGLTLALVGVFYVIFTTFL